MLADTIQPDITSPRSGRRSPPRAVDVGRARHVARARITLERDQTLAVGGFASELLLALVTGRRPVDPREDLRVVGVRALRRLLAVVVPRLPAAVLLAAGVVTFRALLAVVVPRLQLAL